MRRFFALILLTLFGLLAASPALAMGTPVVIGQGSSSASSMTLSFSTTAAANQGDALILSVKGRNAAPSSIVDCQGGTWTLDKEFGPTGSHIEFYSRQATDPSGLPSGCSFTFTWGTTVGEKFAYVVRYPGAAAPASAVGVGANIASTTSPTITTGTSTGVPRGLLCQTVTFGTETPAVDTVHGWSRLGTMAVGTQTFSLDWLEATSTAAVTCNPAPSGVAELMTAVQVELNWARFSPTATASTRHDLATTGAGQ
jgi:hypothetical protein